MRNCISLYVEGVGKTELLKKVESHVRQQCGEMFNKVKRFFITQKFLHL